MTGGDDPYPETDEEKQTVKKDNEKKQSDKKEVGIILTDKDMVGKTSDFVVNKKTMSEWYSESKAVACLMDTGCFAYIDNRLCIYDKKYIERDDKGKLYFTKYAQEHEEECFLQFVVDENGKLHYVTLPESMASKSYNYSDEIDEDIVRKHSLVNEISTEMLAAINGMDFGTALEKLMSKQICGFSVGLLKSTTGLDNRTVSNMRSGKNLTKLNVVSACLGIHVPFPVSSRMLELADLSNRLDVGGVKGDENMVYDQLLHLNWAWDYSDTYDDLVDQEYEYLIHKPPM